MNKVTLARDVTQIRRREIDLGDLMRSLWRGRAVIATCVIVAVLGAIVFLNGAARRYTIEMKVAPSTSTGAGFQGDMGQLGQVAALVGFRIPSAQTVPPFQLYLEALLLPETADVLSTNQDFMRTIFFGEWDQATGAWRQPPPGRLAPVRDVLRRLVGSPPNVWQPPNAARLQGYMKGAIKTVQGARSSVVTITFKHADPQFGIAFLTAVSDAVDSSLRKKMLERTSEYIAYLSQTLRTVTIAEHRLAITQTLSEQEKLRMAASSSTPYAADVFSRPTASMRPTEPRPSLVLLGALLGGLLIGGVLAHAIYGSKSG